MASTPEGSQHSPQQAIWVKCWQCQFVRRAESDLLDDTDVEDLINGCEKQICGIYFWRERTRQRMDEAREHRERAKANAQIEDRTRVNDESSDY